MRTILRSLGIAGLADALAMLATAALLTVIAVLAIDSLPI